MLTEVDTLLTYCALCGSLVTELRTLKVFLTLSSGCLALVGYLYSSSSLVPLLQRIMIVVVLYFKRVQDAQELFPVAPLTSVLFS